MNKEQIIAEENNNRFCSSCGSKISNSQKFCSSCGKKVDKKIFKLNKKQIFLVTWAVVLIIAIGYCMKMKSNQEARVSYLVNVKNFNEDIIMASENLEKISNTVEKYWKENIFDKKHGDDINEAILSAILEKSDEIEKAKSYDKEILTLYSNLKTIPKGSQDLEYLRENINNLYNSYTDFYKFAIDPRGNYTQYCSSNTTKIEKLTTDYTILNNSIKSNKEFEDVQSIK
ncbi:MAG: zinc ribbon domain-containing protein [Paeniclostridium sordellii]|uniref:zinc ribbon domain-containing protein n=2 Tax=Paraclostridium sordellii TaxID=1505 RepID=UPI0005E506A6|nr:zinc ribbon domain-containing protein [Paeniclostridium sordellii]MBS6023651.1 zinc ribbon domain-containing protein [Paeniclostridium sordellii]CEN82973.1 Uncharacterised protein [[Clostridium] sordellii] [Paeniclostridium sordellii]CEN87962.1 Uncharacterised protein [[Clostridium] sordellii] [Paeniclostridium sordellii]CEQ12117.1 Uncharacterised protein [[Clostridium] sordellii] [Paeniclostridium sordellii]CEQ21981.1 Uncharacterised protein [[Clostridium] sordellii] [Paeniclostridium sord